MERHNFLPEAFTHDFRVHWGNHPLRPEFIESTYFLYKVHRHVCVGMWVFVCGGMGVGVCVWGGWGSTEFKLWQLKRIIKLRGGGEELQLISTAINFSTVD